MPGPYVPEDAASIKLTCSDRPAEDIERLCAKRLFVGFDGTTPNDHVRRLIARGVGGVILFGRNCESPEQVAAMCAALKEEAG
eukprot:CAMPEP_0197853046 /NCGR_PEP_ID=MMETSP1438-20131217/21965_1 /TAXON_ID=1461541 /ORGANISM="Pterosperma sp., Strain CCMP1384" /LENGTH=82 /DNA_ID=CAMNT_0043467315 /DNA_START=50 /DNA_END=294 /DNA_ORIENTATION=+